MKLLNNNYNFQVNFKWTPFFLIFYISRGFETSLKEICSWDFRILKAG